jgi:hypothetical protein
MSKLKLMSACMLKPVIPVLIEAWISPAYSAGRLRAQVQTKSAVPPIVNRLQSTRFQARDQIVSSYAYRGYDTL